MELLAHTVQSVSSIVGSKLHDDDIAMACPRGRNCTTLVVWLSNAMGPANVC